MISYGILLARHYQTENLCHLVIIVPPSQMNNEQSCAARWVLDANENQFRRKAIKNKKYFKQLLFYALLGKANTCIYINKQKHFVPKLDQINA